MSNAPVTTYDKLSQPLQITDDTVRRGLIRIADQLCQLLDHKRHTEQRWAADKRWAEGMRSSGYDQRTPRREGLRDYQDTKLKIQHTRTMLRLLLSELMPASHAAEAAHDYALKSALLDAAVDNLILLAEAERAHARQTGTPQWYRTA
jgi:hypothetical protein